MARNIEYNYQIPTKEDDGDEWGAILESFMERMANHVHTGTDSASLTESVEKDTVFYDKSLWIANTGTKEGYHMDIQLPADAQLRNKKVRDFKLTDGTTDNGGWFQAGTKLVEFSPSIEWTSDNTVTIYSNDNSMSLILMVY